MTLCDVDDQAAFARRLHQLSRLTWRELTRAPRHGMGYEKISRDQIRSPIPDEVPEDAAILAFRFQGMKPMLGFRAGRIFVILFVDRDFSLYPHG